MSATIKAHIIEQLTAAQIARPQRRIARLEQLLVYAVDILSTVDTEEARQFVELAREAVSERNGVST